MKKVLLMSLASVVIGVNLTNASQTSKNVTNTLSTSTNTQNQETTNSLVTEKNTNVNNNTVTSQQVANTLENNVENNNTLTNQTTTENIVGPNVGSLNKNVEQNQQNSNIVPNQGMDTKNNVKQKNKKGINKKTQSRNKNNNLNQPYTSGGQNPYAQYFTGSTYFKVLVEKDNIWNSSINNLTFLAGSRSNWHKYSGGHIILVTSGEGRYQEKGKQIQVLKAGDVVKVVPNIEHWYGAAPNVNFSVMSVETNLPNNQITWLNAVTGAEYK